MMWKCALGPALYKFHDGIWHTYKPGNLERWGDNLVASLLAAWSIGVYVLPFVVLYRRNCTLAENAQSTARLAAGVGAVLVASLAMRGYARSKNPKYLEFARSLENASDDRADATRRRLRDYEFDFKAWPIDWKHETSAPRKLASLNWDRKRDGITLLFCKLVAYVVTHTVALKLMYPGSISFLNWAMRAALLEGRTAMLDQGGERYKLLAADGNTIDCMLLDRRNKTRKGKYLVITCEGNCGFYEIGIAATPITKGYSVLGWNHPGFGGSTGQPLPLQEQAAIDCAMTFALEHLNFPLDRIILYGWSIGGYTATWAAANYPGIDSLILDATFDDVLHLAIARMPKWIECIVRIVVREHLNLNVAEQLNTYDGPVLLVRRTDDEIMCAYGNGIIHNRANMLLTKLLTRRYPELFANCHESHVALKEYCAEAHDPDESSPSSIEQVIEDECARELENYAKKIADGGDGKLYPSALGREASKMRKSNLVKFLARVYMVDQASQHCQPLEPELFRRAWNLETWASFREIERID